MLFDAKQGNDPAQAAKKRTRDAIDLEFGRYIETFTEGYLKHEWKDSWADGKRQLELHALPHLKGRPLPEIEKHELAAIIRRLKDRPALARNTHAVLRKLIRSAENKDELLAQMPISYY